MKNRRGFSRSTVLQQTFVTRQGKLRDSQLQYRKNLPPKEYLEGLLRNLPSVESKKHISSERLMFSPQHLESSLMEVSFHVKNNID